MLEHLNVLCPILPEHASVHILLHLDVFEAPVHHVLLLQLEQLHIPWHLRKHQLEEHSRKDEHVLNVHEEAELLCERPAIILVRAKDQQDHVGGCGQRAVDVEGRAPRLVGLRALRNGPLPPFAEALHVDEYLDDDAQERRGADPRGRHREERGVAVRDQVVVKVAESIVRLLLRLLLRGRHVGELQQGGPVAVGQAMVVVVVAAAPPESDLWVGILHEIRKGQSEEDQDPELGLEV
mmetsp:Transcript_77002/g.225854  ORF Transcript_77002/g.225854 Transcript_77002/m.225854 type:complete len:237 (-) Transcript_77002:1356-2066(-)